MTVGVQAVDPTTYGKLESGACGVTDGRTMQISYGVFEDTAPGSVRTGCSYLRAVYKATDNTYLPLSKIEQGANSTVILTPVVPAAQAENQAKVVLSLPADLVQSRIFLQYGDNSQALPLTFTPAGGASDVAVLDATSLSEDRTVRVDKSTSGYTYDFTVEVPRERSLTVTADDDDATLTIVADNSTAAKTVRRYRVTYPADTPKLTKKVEVTASSGAKTVSVRGRSLQGNRTAGTGVFEYADDCGGVNYGSWLCKANATEPDSGSYGFFYSVLDTASNTLDSYDANPNGSDYAFAHRYGISGVESSTKVFWSGWDYWGYQQPDFDNSATSGTDYQQRVKQAAAQSVAPNEVSVAPQAYGTGKVQFYVQNNGMSADPMVSAHVKGKHSYFISAVRVNGQVLQVPFPSFTNEQIMSNTFDKDSNLWRQYQSARSAWLGGTNQVPELPRPMHNCTSVFAPRQYAQYKLTTGPNAGSTITVEMVNARLAGDYLADGYSVGWKTGGSWNKFGWDTDDSQMKRHHYVWFNGPAMQMIDNSTCVATTRGDSTSDTYLNDGVKTGPRHSYALDNQWKTMYRVTIDGMAADAYNVDVIWGITSQGFVYNAGGQVLDDNGRVTIKRAPRSPEKDDEVLAAPLPEDNPDMQNPFSSSGDKTGLSGTAVVRQYCSTESDSNCYVPLASENNGVRVHIKDGYVDPKAEMAVLGQNTAGTDTTNRVTKDMVQLKTVDQSYANDPSAFGVDMDWPRNISQTFTTTRLGGRYETTIGLSRQVNLSFTGTQVNVPVLYLANTLTTTQLGDTPYLRSEDSPILAGKDVVPSQWSGENGGLSPQWVNKTDSAYQQVQGAVPVSPEPGKVFVGYKAYGVKFANSGPDSEKMDLTQQAAAKTQNGEKAAVLIDKDQRGNPLLGGNLFPGDTIDIAGTYPDGTARVRLSNDTFTASRVDAVWMVPVFESGTTTRSRTYNAVNVAVGADGDKTEISNAFSFVGAPGLKATVASSYQPAATLAVDGTTYRHQGPDTRMVTTLPANSSISGLEFVYRADQELVTVDKVWQVNGTRYADGAQPAHVSAALTLNGAAATFGQPAEATPFGTPFTISEKVTAASGYQCSVSSATLRQIGVTPSTITNLSKNTATSAWETSAPNNAGAQAAGSAGSKDTVTISYSMGSAEPDRELPVSVKNVLTTTSVNAPYGTLVAPPALTQYRVEDRNGKGIWIFKGWSTPVVSATRPQTVTGRWEYTEDNVNSTFAVGYQWALPTTLTGTVPDELKALPAVKVYDGNKTTTVTKPANPTHTTISTAQGKLVFRGWTAPSGEGQTWIGTWEFADAHSVKYAWTVMNGGSTVTVDPASYIGTLLTDSLPKAEMHRHREGETVTPAGVLNSVVNYREREVNGLGWGSLVFTGWDKDTATVGSGDVTFTARFVAKERDWIRGIALTNTSATAAASGRRLTIPASIEHQMQAAIIPTMTAVQNSQTGLAITPWKAPDWSGQSYRDDVNHGYWTFSGFTYTPNGGAATEVPETGVAASDFPKGEHAGDRNAAWGTDENIYRTGAIATGTLKNKALPVQATWTFRADPVYQLVNTVSCQALGSTVSFAKTVQNDTGFTDGQPSADKFALKLTNVNDANKTYTIQNGQTSSSAVPEGTYTVSEVASAASNTTLTQIWKPSTVAGKGYSCKDKSGMEKVSSGTLTVPADGGTLACSVTNNAAVVSLVTYDANAKKFIDSSEYSYDLKPVNESAQAYTHRGWSAKSSIDDEDSTHFLTPSVDYKLDVANKPFATRVTLQRYWGDVATYDDATAATATWVNVPDMNKLSFLPNKRAIYRVVVEPIRPTLPLTGGMGADQFILLGLGLLVLAGGAAAVIRRRRQRAMS